MSQWYNEASGIYFSSTFQNFLFNLLVLTGLHPAAHGHVTDFHIYSVPTYVQILIWTAFGAVLALLLAVSEPIPPLTPQVLLIQVKTFKTTGGLNISKNESALPWKVGKGKQKDDET